MVYRNNWQAKDLNQLKVRIKYCISKVDHGLIYKLCKQVPGLLNNIRINGLVENKTITTKLLVLRRYEFLGKSINLPSIFLMIRPMNVTRH